MQFFFPALTETRLSTLHLSVKQNSLSITTEEEGVPVLEVSQRVRLPLMNPVSMIDKNEEKSRIGKPQMLNYIPYSILYQSIKFRRSVL